MIVDTVLNAVFSVVNTILSPIPTVAIDLDPSLLAAFYQYMQLVLWILPCGTIISILGIHLTICIFRIVVSVIKTIWQLLPLL